MHPTLELPLLMDRLVRNRDDTEARDRYNAILAEAGLAPISVHLGTLSIFPRILAHPHGAHCEFRGSVDSAGVLVIKKFFVQCVEAKRPHVILDSESLQPFSSVALGGFIKYSDVLKGEGGSVHMYNLHPKSLIVIEMLGLEVFLNVHGTLDDCLSSLPKE